jgi:hypothetical protein
VTSNPERLLVLGSLSQSLGYAYEPSGGIWAGVDLNPFVFPAFSALDPAVSALLTLGYSGQDAAIGVMIGISSSVFGEAGRIVGMLAGLTFRVGSTNGAHMRMRLAWDVAPFIPVPMNGELDINVPVNRRFGVNFHTLGDVGLMGVLSTVGLQYYHHTRASRKGAPITVFTVGAGAAVSFLGAAGPAVSFAFEPRW